MVHGWRLLGTQIDRNRFYDPFNMQHTKYINWDLLPIISVNDDIIVDFRKDSKT